MDKISAIVAAILAIALVAGSQTEIGGNIIAMLLWY